MTLNEAVKVAEAAHQRGKFEVAEQAYLKILNDFKSNDATFGLATLYAHLKKYDRAIALFTTALAEEPLAVDITLNFSMCLIAANKTEQALKLINDFRPHIPDDAYIINSFAHLALSLKQPALVLDIAIKHQSENLQTKIIIAKAHMQNENWSKAISVWRKLSTLALNQADIQKNLSICYAKLREYKNAICAFDAFLQCSKSDSNNLLKFADLYLLARNVKQARIQLDKAIILKNLSLTRYEIEIRICRFESNKEATLIAADKALKLNPYSYIAWGAKQEIGAQHHQTVNQLANLLAQSVGNAYEYQQNLFVLAKAYEKLAQYRLAFRCFNKANSLQEDVIGKSNLPYNCLREVNHGQFLKQVSSPLYKTPPLTANNIFIVGMPRSGTTLMDRILSQHPKVESSGENEALALFIENKINAQQNNREVNWDLFFEQNSQAFRQSYLTKTALNADIILDKMPHNFRYVGAILSIFEQVKVIQMRRTPEDLALSIFCQPFAPHHNYAANLKTIAHAIFQANQLMDFWSQNFPKQVIDVHYNQLTNNPINEANRVFDFCALDWDDDYLNFHKKHVNSFTFSELQVRQPINTAKQNFARHYKKELALFRDFYNQLSQAKY
jgi:tetratricopeptide (TPR) repeat protein